MQTQFKMQEKHERSVENKIHYLLSDLSFAFLSLDHLKEIDFTHLGNSTFSLLLQIAHK